MAKFIVKCSALDNQNKSQRVSSPEFDAKNEVEAIKLGGGHVDALISEHSLVSGQYKIYRCKQLLSAEKCIAEGQINSRGY
jgi:hypothetical protein